jgi:hypothetical protein
MPSAAAEKFSYVRRCLIPSWEGPSADPEEKRGPASDLPHQIDGAV